MTTNEVGSGVTTDSPSGQQVSISQQMMDAVKSFENEADQSVDSSNVQKASEAPEAASGKQHSVETEEPVDSSEIERQADSGEGKKLPESIPYSAFQKRITKLNQRNEASEQRAVQAELELQKLKYSFEVFQREYDELYKKAAQGQRPDPRDDELQLLRLEKEVKAKHSELESQFQKRIQEERANAIAQVEGEKLLNHITDLVSTKYQLASEREVVEYLANVNPDANPEEVAKKIHNDRLKKAGLAPKPAAPKSVGTRGAQVDMDFSPNVDGMLEYLKSIGKY